MTRTGLILKMPTKLFVRDRAGGTLVDWAQKGNRLLGRYVFKNRFNRAVVTIIDATGYTFRRVFPRQGRRPDKVNKILIMSLDHIGDVIFTTAAVKHMRAHYRDAEMTVMVGPWAVDVYKNNPHVDKVEVFEAPWFSRGRTARSSVSAFFQGVSLVKRGCFDLAIDMRGDLRNILMMALGRTKYRVGYGITGGGFLLDLEPLYSVDQHAVEKDLELVRSLGIKATDGGPEFFYSSADVQQADTLRTELRLTKKDRVVVLHPGAGSRSKQWSPENFSKVGDSLVEKTGARILVSGSQVESSLCKAVVSGMKQKATVIAGRLDLAALGAFLSKTSLFICGDTGPLHLAVAVGVPVVAVYSGQNDVKIWGPYGEKAIVISKEVECRLCGRKDCDDHRCMDLITPEEVVGPAVRLLLDKRPTPTPKEEKNG